MATHDIGGKGIPDVESLATFSKGKVAPTGHPDGDGGRRQGPSRRPPRQPEASEGPDISDLASAVFALEEVLRTHPGRFSRALSNAAEALDRDAARAGDPHARLLRELAHRFREGARAGVLPALLVPEPAAAGHPPPPHSHVQSYAVQQAVAGGDPVRDATLDLARAIRGAIRSVGL